MKKRAILPSRMSLTLPDDGDDDDGKELNDRSNIQDIIGPTAPSLMITQTTQELRRKIDEIIGLIGEHKQKFLRLCSILIGKLEDLSHTKFIEIFNNGECVYRPLFQMNAYDMVMDATQSATGSVTTYNPIKEQLHGLSIVPSIKRANIDNNRTELRYMLKLVPQDSNARLVLPMICGSSQRKSSHTTAGGTSTTNKAFCGDDDDDSIMMLEMKIQMHFLLSKNDSQSNGRGDIGKGSVHSKKYLHHRHREHQQPQMSNRKIGTDLRSLNHEIKNIFSGAIVTTDTEAMMAETYTTNKFVGASSSGVHVTMETVGMAINDVGREKPMVVINAITFSTESVLSSTDLPRWPLYMAQCLVQEDPSLFRHLIDNYRVVTDLNQQKADLDLIIADRPNTRTRTPSSGSVTRNPYERYTRPVPQSRVMYPSSSISTGRSRIREQIGSNNSDDDSCVIS